MRLAVFVELEPMFQLAQELVRLGQSAIFGTGQEAFILQARERQHGTSVADPRVGAAVQALQALDQKFDVADSSALQLHIDSTAGPPALRLPGGKLFVDAL